MGIYAKKFRLTLVIGLALIIGLVATALAGTFEPITVTDQTTTMPLVNPAPSSFQPRYISGFGTDNSFTVFFEDRDNGNAISYAQTTSGPTGLPASATATNIADTHLLVKDWPITIEATTYAYRAWGAVGNNTSHKFYVSNDLTNWVLVSTFTIPNVFPWTSPRPLMPGYVYHGFHDVILLNGTYYAFAESNRGQTLLVRSVNGDDVWEAFDSVGGTGATWGPLQLPESGTPSGSFVDLGHDRGYGKVHVRGNDSGFYLAVNTVAKPSMAPADLEAAFINPANWTWHDGSTGLPTTPILSATDEHDLRECWVVPNSDPDADWVIVYDADFGSADGGKALGYATLSPPLPPPEIVWVNDDWTSQGDVDIYDPSLTWQYNAFNSLQDGIDAVPSGTASKRSIVNVFNGDYQTPGQTIGGYKTGILVESLDYLTIQAVPGNEPTAKPLAGGGTSLGIESSNHIIIDNIDLDGSLAGFDRLHVRNSDYITLKNSEIAFGIDGIDVETGGKHFVIENNVLKSLSGDAVDFSDGAYSDITIQDNIFHSDNRRPILIRNLGALPIGDFIIRRNISLGTNDQEAFRIIGASNVLIENNVLMNSMQQGVYIDTGCSNITIRHNTFFNNDQGLEGNGEVRTKVTSADIVIKNNIFYANGSNPVIETAAASLPGEDHNLVYNYSGLFTFGANTITGMDPLFVSMIPGSEDLHLQAGSPAIEAGMDLGVSDDIEKSTRPNPAGTDPDTGAYEVARPAPREAKQGVIADLSALLATGDKETDHQIEEAIKHIDKSLDPSLWETDSTLTKHGKKVFDEEKKAVHELMEIVKAQSDYATDAQAALDTLVGVDALLAQTAIDEAIDAGGNPKEIAKAEEEMTKALEELDHTKKDGTPDPRYDKAIDHYKKAWEHACKAKETKRTKTAAIEPLAIVDQLQVVAYPNPIRDVHTATFQVMGTMAAEVEEIRVQIYDLSGHLVWEGAALGSELDWHTDSLSGDYLANGIYLYRVQVRIGASWIIQDTGNIAVLR